VIRKTKVSQQVSEYIQDFMDDNPVYSNATLLEMSKEPWLYDYHMSKEEAMMWKMKGVCHVCHIDPNHHRDDCPWSHNQLMFAELERVDQNHFKIDIEVGKILAQLKK